MLYKQNKRRIKGASPHLLLHEGSCEQQGWCSLSTDFPFFAIKLELLKFSTFLSWSFSPVLGQSDLWGGGDGDAAKEALK